MFEARIKIVRENYHDKKLTRKSNESLLENSDNDMSLNLIAINKLHLTDVWGPS